MPRKKVTKTRKTRSRAQTKPHSKRKTSKKSTMKPTQRRGIGSKDPGFGTDSDYRWRDLSNTRRSTTKSGTKKKLRGDYPDYAHAGRGEGGRRRSGPGSPVRRKRKKK